MEYPNSKITKPVRSAILSVFIALFFIISPAIIMYTSGYRYDFKKGLLRETGAINIDIEPKNATVFLNGIKIKSQMPVRLNDRTPGKYLVNIAAPGYFEWQKEVEVKNKQTVYIKEVSVLEKNDPLLINEGSFSNVALSFNGEYLSYIGTVGNNQELHIRNLASGEDTVILRIEDGLKKIVTWAPANNFFTVSNEAPPYNDLLIFNAAKLDKKTDLTGQIKNSVEKYEWKETAEPELYFSTKLRLMSFLPITEQQFNLGKNVWIDWYMENGQLWTLRASSNTKQIEIISDTLGFSGIFADDNTFTPTEQDIKILFAKDGQVLLKKNTQPEMILVLKDKKFSIAGDKYYLSKYNDWWLIWTPWEIWTYVKGYEPNLLNRSGEGLNEVLPLDKNNTLALIWDDKSTALYPYYLVTHDLLNIGMASAAADSKNRVLYFAAKIGGKNGLWKLDY